MEVRPWVKYDGFVFRDLPLSSVRTPLVGIFCYLAVIYGLRAWMKKREPMRLRVPTLIHNAFLCALSVSMAVGTLVELFMAVRNHGGLMSIVCDRSHETMSGMLAVWMYIFYASKYYELLDTVIMVLKKRPLNFLHVYHHCVVMPLFWVYMETDMVIHWILVVANSMVHVAMYYYYAIATLGKTVWWKKYITQAQILQFVIDVTATWPFPVLYYSSAGCSGSMRGWIFGQAVGLSFFKLFSDFYRRSYKTKSDGATAVTPPESSESTKKQN